MTNELKPAVPTRVAMSCVVDLAIRRGMRISVHDGQETVLSKSADADAIQAAMYSTDSETLTFWDAAELGSSDHKQGWMVLVHDAANTGLDCVAEAYGKPVEAIYDYFQAFCDRLTVNADGTMLLAKQD